MVGFIGDQAKAARQSGIQLTGPQMTMLTESFAADRLAEEEAKEAEKAENARAEEDTE